MRIMNGRIRIIKAAEPQKMPVERFFLFMGLYEIQYLGDSESKSSRCFSSVVHIKTKFKRFSRWNPMNTIVVILC